METKITVTYGWALVILKKENIEIEMTLEEAGYLIRSLLNNTRIDTLTVS
jgi:hypothetical protein